MFDKFLFDGLIGKLDTVIIAELIKLVIHEVAEESLPPTFLKDLSDDQLGDCFTHSVLHIVIIKAT